MSTTPTVSLARLYDDLSRFQWLRSRKRRKESGTGLDMHKSLKAAALGREGPPAGAHALNAWIFDMLEIHDGLDVLDLGCGFGGTAFDWLTRADIRYTGLTLSAYQVHKARAHARSRGLDSSCQFVLQDYHDEILGSFDRVLSIEALFHARDLSSTLHSVVSTLRPGGSLFLLEDVAKDQGVQDSPVARSLLRRWSSRALHTSEDYTIAGREAGLTLEKRLDLTAQVDYRDSHQLDRSERRLRLARCCVPVTKVRRVIDAFLGGLDLERLYGQGHMRYEAMLFRKESPLS